MDIAFIKEIYNSCYAATDKSVTDRALNKVCWNCAFAPRPYTDDEMREWRDNTVEIILFSLLDNCTEYTGVDVAQEGISYINSRLTEEEKEKVSLYVMEAKEIDTLPKRDYDIAFINSATQYMGPDSTLESYIGMMIEHVKVGGRIFLGDIKSLLYREQFYRCAENFVSPQSVSDAKIARRKKLDFEHYISANFAQKLEEKFPRIKKAEIRAKRGKAVTEMNLFRFNMVLYLDHCEEKTYHVINTPINNIGELEEIVKNTKEDRICLKHLRNKLFYENVSVKFGESEPCTASFYISDIYGLFETYGYRCHAVPYRNEIDAYFEIYAEKNGRTELQI